MDMTVCENSKPNILYERNTKHKYLFHDIYQLNKYRNYTHLVLNGFFVLSNCSSFIAVWSVGKLC